MTHPEEALHPLVAVSSCQNSARVSLTTPSIRHSVTRVQHKRTVQDVTNTVKLKVQTRQGFYYKVTSLETVGLMGSQIDYTHEIVNSLNVK